MTVFGTSLRGVNLRSGSVRLVVGQVVGQGGQFVALPFLTRTYTPEEYGLYQLGLALALIIQPIATLRNEFVIPVAHSMVRVRRLYRQALVTMLLVVLALGACAQVTGSGDIRKVLTFMAPLLLGNAWTILDNSRLLRQNNLDSLALRNLLTGGLTAASQIVLAITGQPLVLLPWAVLAARALAIAATPSPSKSDSAQLPGGGASDSVRTSAVSIIAGVFSNSSVYGLTLLMAAAYPPTWNGHVGIAQRVVNVPVSLAGQALGQAYQVQAADKIRNQRNGLRAFTVSFMLRLLLLSLPFVALTAALGPLLAPIVLGTAWAQAGIVIAILALPAGLQLAVSPVVALLVMLNRERQLLALQVLRLSLSLLAGFSLGFFMQSVHAAVAGYAGATVVAYILTGAIAVRAAAAHDRLVHLPVANDVREAGPQGSMTGPRAGADVSGAPAIHWARR